MADEISDNNSDASPPIHELVDASPPMRTLIHHIYAATQHRTTLNRRADCLTSNGYTVRQIMSEEAG